MQDEKPTVLITSSVLISMLMISLVILGKVIKDFYNLLLADKHKLEQGNLEFIKLNEIELKHTLQSSLNIFTKSFKDYFQNSSDFFVYDSGKVLIRKNEISDFLLVSKKLKFFDFKYYQYLPKKIILDKDLFWQLLRQLFKEIAAEITFENLIEDIRIDVDSKHKLFQFHKILKEFNDGKNKRIQENLLDAAIKTYRNSKVYTLHKQLDNLVEQAKRINTSKVGPLKYLATAADRDAGLVVTNKNFQLLKTNLDEYAAGRANIKTNKLFIRALKYCEKAMQFMIAANIDGLTSEIQQIINQVDSFLKKLDSVQNFFNDQVLGGDLVETDDELIKNLENELADLHPRLDKLEAKVENFNESYFALSSDYDNAKSNFELLRTHIQIPFQENSTAQKIRTKLEEEKQRKAAAKKQAAIEEEQKKLLHKQAKIERKQKASIPAMQLPAETGYEGKQEIPNNIPLAISQPNKLLPNTQQMETAAVVSTANNAINVLKSVTQDSTDNSMIIETTEQGVDNGKLTELFSKLETKIKQKKAINLIKANFNSVYNLVDSMASKVVRTSEDQQRGVRAILLALFYLFKELQDFCQSADNKNVLGALVNHIMHVKFIPDWDIVAATLIALDEAKKILLDNAAQLSSRELEKNWVESIKYLPITRYYNQQNLLENTSKAKVVNFMADLAINNISHAIQDIIDILESEAAALEKLNDNECALAVKHALLSLGESLQCLYQHDKALYEAFNANKALQPVIKKIVTIRAKISHQPREAILIPKNIFSVCKMYKELEASFLQSLVLLDKSLAYQIDATMELPARPSLRP